jgi:hypothetical protein
MSDAREDFIKSLWVADIHLLSTARNSIADQILWYNVDKMKEQKSIDIERILNRGIEGMEVRTSLEKNLA